MQVGDGRDPTTTAPAGGVVRAPQRALDAEPVSCGDRHAFGGWLELIYQPQYGEADAPTVSGNLADEILAEDQAPPADPDDEATE